jgi:hypothetical protein
MKTPEELGSFVKNKLKRGYPEGELRNELLQEGYTAEQIQKAVYDPPTDPLEIKKAQRKILDNNPFWYLTSIGIIIIGMYRKSSEGNHTTIYTWLLIGTGIIGLGLKIILPLIEDLKKK